MIPDSITENKIEPWVGLDIGGANLKAAHTSGWSNSISFPMWKEWKNLAGSIARLLDECPPIHGVAVTMTGELADCFATRTEGVAMILEQVTAVIPSVMVRVYSVDGSWRTVPQAARETWSVAASNWHGLARFAARWTHRQPSLLVDIGSTTTDIIPIRDGNILLDAQTDSQRLQTGSLVYTGIERSNIAGILREVTLFGSLCPIMNELFATTRDVYLWLREIEDCPDDCETADNQPATRAAARYRLARVVGEDGSTLTDSDIDAIANEVFQAQTDLIVQAFDKLLARTNSKKKTSKKVAASTSGSKKLDKVETVVLSGHGDFLIEAALAKWGWDGNRIRLSEKLGAALSRCAPAFAIASLASEEMHAGVLCPERS